MAIEAQSYEYKILEVGAEGVLGLSKTSELPEDRLNELGVRGWELAEQINMENGATQALIFKRPVSGDRKEKVEKESRESSGGVLGTIANKAESVAEEAEKN